MLTSLFSIPMLVGLLLGLAALPVLIHLINMLRHRRVKWAAMDFLLQSYKKNRNWVWLKQFLLLLMRVAAMILLVLMLAQVGCRSDRLSLGSRVTHHYVLLDDSFSMSDRVGDQSAFDRARQAVRLIGQRAGAETNQQFTLIRFSRAVGADPDDKESFNPQSLADLSSAPVDVNFDVLLDERLSALDVSYLSAGPASALDVVRQLVEDRGEERSRVYIVSDFREKEWNTPTELQKSLEAISSDEAQVHLVNCVKQQRPNLAMTAIRPTAGTRAAGVPFFMDVSVKNFGDSDAKNVQLKVNTITYDQADELLGDPQNVRGNVEPLPTVLFEEVPAGKTETRRIQVYFEKGGQHAVEAILPEDAVQADNRRWAVVEFPEGVPVLVIDGSENSRATRHLGLAFQPGKNKTGIRPDFRSLAFLRQANSDSLSRYRVIYLLDVDLGDDQAIVRRLENFVQAGGGLALFLGPHVDINSYNRNLFKDGAGLLPLPLDVITSLPEETGEDLPDIIADDHPVFETFKNIRNTFVKKVVLDRYIKPPEGWTADDDANVIVAASTRQRHPLAVERRFGKGRVLAVTTTLQPQWNNWATNPTFVITMLNLQSHLGGGAAEETPRVAGQPIQLQLEKDQYLGEVQFVIPAADADTRLVIKKQARGGDSSPFIQATLGGAGGEGGPQAGETDRPGIYEAWSFTTANVAEVHRWSVNVETAEGDLAIDQPQALLSRLESVDPIHVHWEDFDPDPGAEEGFSWAKTLLIILIGLLVVEQLLAYATSYHPVRRGAAA